MVTRETAWPPGVPCWVDLEVDELEQSKTFYSSLFGWELDVGPAETGGYTTCKQSGKVVAGLSPRFSPPRPPMWSVYLASDDADATARSITEAGGTVMVEPMEVMELGRMLFASDPGGAMFGVWQARQHLGAELTSEPVSIAWNENMSRDFDVNKAFYRQVFGYEYTDVSDDTMTYAIFSVGDLQAGGFGRMDESYSAQTPAQWTVVFSVSDADASLAKVVELGGSITMDAMDTPYGRIGSVTDNLGAPFDVISELTS